ncbi:hypothetical protein JY97_11080 [Alkalispirochaeta odontotermitis]|nr:hypothetical protein JY97_11080 [Alkalispirochaeta odontotermitis]
MFLVNYLAVIVALVAFTVVGMLWYGPLFGKKWMKLAGFSESDMKTPEAKKSATTGYIASIISSFVAMLALAVVLNMMGINNALGGLIAGALLSFGFIAMTLVGEAAWHGKPALLILLNSMYRILGFAIAGLIIGAWQ